MIVDLQLVLAAALLGAYTATPTPRHAFRFRDALPSIGTIKTAALGVLHQVVYCSNAAR
jgi:hypothetical protein